MYPELASSDGKLQHHRRHRNYLKQGNYPESEELQWRANDLLVDGTQADISQSLNEVTKTRAKDIRAEIR